MNAEALFADLLRRWPAAGVDKRHERINVTLDVVALPDAVQLVLKQGAWLAGIIAEDAADGLRLSYPLLPSEGDCWVVVQLPVGATPVPSIAEISFSADWQEREIEDLFEIHFVGHPQLGDFVLHNEEWPEGMAPMRRAFAANHNFPRHENPNYRPPKVLHAAGAFTMTVGPIYSDIVEAAQFQLETIGEEVVSTRPRFFYKYRGLEKIGEGQDPWRVVLLAERLNGTSAVAHALACAQALETIAACDVPPRARRLRVIVAELERLRSHTATIAAICKSTGLSVPTNHAYALLETLLRLSGKYFGHRYLFGFIVPGGVSLDLPDADLQALVSMVTEAAGTLARLGEDLSFDNSFLDRIEEVGVIEPDEAMRYGLLGPIGRASGRRNMDMRQRAPYADYASLAPSECAETEGDGYARLRVFLAEAAESARLIARALDTVPEGAVSTSCQPGGGSALGWSETPAGACVQWLSLDATGKVSRWRILPAAFVNWHAFHLAAENFAFQDFPITLATVGLSVAEADR